MAPGDPMTSRQRILAALRGEPADRPPLCFDLQPFRKAFRRMGIADPQAHFGIDLTKIWFEPSARPPTAEAPARQPAPRPAPDAPRVGDDRQIANYRRWGYHPERIDHRHPLIAAATPADIDAYDFPVVRSPEDVARLQAAVESAHAAGRAVAGQVPHLGGVLFETAYRLRGLDNLLEDFRSRPAFAELLLERITEAACRNVAQLVAARVDIVLLGDDIGTPTSMLLSPDMWRQWLKPRLARIIQAARQIDPRAAVAYHSDGFFLPVVEDLIEIGVEILNPVQPDCLDPLAVRERFGDALTVWGTVGSATLLPYGAPEEIRAEVRLRKKTLGAAGRLILAPAYDLEDNVPLENVLAFFEGCRS